jgi:hypothetical protein
VTSCVQGTYKQYKEVKVSYKGKIESVRENRRIFTHTQPQDAYDYRFHFLFSKISMSQ